MGILPGNEGSPQGRHPLLDHIASLLRELGLSFQLEDKRITASMQIHDTPGHLLVSLTGGGEIANFELIGLVPPAVVQSSDQKSRFIEYLFARNWSTASGALEMDSDGEVRAVLEVPLADAVMTVRQLALILKSLVSHGESLVTSGLSLLRSDAHPTEPAPSSLDLPSSPGAVSASRVMEAFLKLARAPGGRDKLLRVQSDGNAPEVLRSMAGIMLSSTVPDSL